MTGSLVRDRNARVVVFSLALMPMVACSHAAPRPAGDVAPASVAADTVRRAIPLAELPDGSRIRYNMGDRWYGVRVARSKRVAADTLWVDTGWFLPDRAIPVARLRRLEFSANEKELERRMNWAVAIGAATGVIIGPEKPGTIQQLGLTLDPPDCDGCARTHYPSESADAAVLLGMYGAVLGAVGGAIVLPAERWVRVDVPAGRR